MPSENRPHSASFANSLADYATLGLKPSASKEDVKRAYRRLVKELHPDSIGAVNGFDKQRLDEISIAYQNLLKVTAPKTAGSFQYANLDDQKTKAARAAKEKAAQETKEKAAKQYREDLLRKAKAQRAQDIKEYKEANKKPKFQVGLFQRKPDASQALRSYKAIDEPAPPKPNLDFYA